MIRAVLGSRLTLLPVIAVAILNKRDVQVAGKLRFAPDFYSVATGLLQCLWKTIFRDGVSDDVDESREAALIRRRVRCAKPSQRWSCNRGG